VVLLMLLMRPDSRGGRGGLVAAVTGEDSSNGWTGVVLIGPHAMDEVPHSGPVVAVHA